MDTSKAIQIAVAKADLFICSALRWLIMLVLFWSVIMLGIYGVGYDTSGFIYAQF